VLTGALGLVTTAVWAPGYAGACALLYIGLGVWGFASADDRALASLLARCPWTDAFHVAVGAAALAALALSFRRRT
jgi:hypothetical protein